ncbi:hypothetical protein BJY01DRAFT_238979 [Aspergillus pseudoustus]|uniref:Rhodopsin domain-containing protein n=1 Tax=Aspergillus pseudoustus TaxID=1810923 RepID=A0ABR4J4B6_9EURO
MAARDAQHTNNAGIILERNVWIVMAITVLTVILRAIAKLRIRRVGANDAVMMLAVVWLLTCTVRAAALLTVAVNHGFGGNLDTLDTQSRKLALMYTSIQVAIVTISSAAARSSFILYLLAIVNTHRKSRTALWTALLLQLSVNAVSSILPFTICRDVCVLWDTTITTTCGDTSAALGFSYFASTLNTATDLFLTVLPTMLFWNLNLKLRVEISLIALLILAAVALVASIIKPTKVKDVADISNIRSDGGIGFPQWSYGENAILIITSSLPSLRSLILTPICRRSTHSPCRPYELSDRLGTNNGKHHVIRSTVGSQQQQELTADLKESDDHD